MFNDYYGSYDEFYDTMLRGNEVEFKYLNEKYYLLPFFEGEKVVGVTFGEAYSEEENIYFSKEELYNAKIGDTILGNVLDDIEFLWLNF